jgi:DNA-binding IclR family transcriptional regulator
MSNNDRPQNIAKYHVPALEKGLDILETLTLTPSPQSLTDLARRLGRSSSELFRMLNCLERRHYVIKDEAGNYRLSLKLYELAHTYSPLEQLLRVAAEPMNELAQAVRESCHLSVLSHGKLMVIAQAESPRRVRLSVGVGRAFSAIHTASGRLLLAYLPPDKQAVFLGDDPDYQKLAEGEQKELALKLAQICRQGYSSAENESHLGVKDISVLVGNPHIGLSAALAIPYLIATGRPAEGSRLLAALQACAGKITQATGVTP